jgi:hypothetical protein
MDAAAAPADNQEGPPRPSYWDADVGGQRPPASAPGAAAGAPPNPAAGDSSRPSYWDTDLGQDNGPPAPTSKAKPPSVTYDAAEFKRRVGRDPEPAELANFAQFKGRGWANESGAPPPGPPPSALGRFIHDTISDPTLSGYEKAKQTAAILASPVRSKEDTAATIAAAQRAMPSEPDFQKDFDKQYAQSHGFFGVLDAYIDHPKAAFASFVEGMVRSTPEMAGFAAAGPAGAGGVAYLDKYGETVLTTLSQHGVDLSDKGAVLKALNDPALMKLANDAAATAGIPAAVINAASFGIMGRVAGPIIGRLGGGIGGRVAGATGEVATQGVIGAGGEAATQEYISGRITDPKAIAQAGISQVAATAPFMAGHVRGGAHEGAPPLPAGAPEVAPEAANAPAATEDLAAAAARAGEAVYREDSLGVINQTVAPARRAVVETGPANAVEHAQRDAAAHVAAQGGDALDQTVAATHANAVVGGHHDAAAVQGAREARQQAAAQQMADDAALEAQNVPPNPAEEAFARAEADQVKQKEADFARAKNQVGDQQIEAGERSMAGAERGGANEPLPTLADVMTPEQQQAFATLKARRAAEMAQPQPEPTVVERMRAQARGTDEDFQELPPAVPPTRLAAIRATAEKRQAAERVPVEKAAEPAEEAAQPDTNPAPATVATLKARRQAVLDQAIAAKVGRPEGAPAPGERPTLTLVGKRAAAGAEAPTGAEVDAAAHEAATSSKNDLPMPTEAQQNAGNFKMGKIDVQGLPISIEHPEGSTRPSGATIRGSHYGYVRGTVDADGMHTDVMVGKHPENDTAFVVDHLDQNGEYQQHKLLLGFNNKLEALKAYRSAFPDNPLGPVSELKTPALKDWLANGDTTRPYDQKAVNRIADTRTRFADSRPQPARPEDVQHAVQPDGTHIAETPGGRTTAIDHPNGTDIQVKGTETQRSARGRDEGTARLERLAQIAHERGGSLESDNRVSAPAQEVYRKLAERGYQVETRPHETNTQGEKVSASELRGVYSVGPRDMTKLTGMQLRRLAHTGDTAARAEMDRRVNAPSEPTGGAPKQTPAQARDMQPGERRGAAITKEEATRRLQPLIDKLGDKLQVHDGLGDPEVPEHVRQDARDFNHPDPRAVYDPAEGTIRVFAGAGGHPDLESLHNTAIHEMAHRGIRSFLGDEYSSTLRDMYANLNARGKAWARDYLSQHDMDPRNPEHQAVAADEFAAHIAEHDVNDPRQRDPSVLRRVIDAVRAGLRRLSVVHEWTDNDIRRLLRESNNNTESPHARAATEYQGNGLRWADSEDRSTEQLPLDHPLAQQHRYDQALENSANHGPGYVKSRLDALDHARDALPDWAQDAWDKAKIGTRRAMLFAMVPRRNRADFISQRNMPQVREYDRLVQQMEGEEGRLKLESHAVMERWNNWAQKAGQELAAKLAKMMHESTLAKADPSKPFEYRYSEDDRAKSPTKAAHDEARKAYYMQKGRPDYNSPEIGDEGRKIYQDVRDHYKQQRDNYFAALDQDSGIGGAARKLLPSQRGEFESGRVPEPYFSLQRFGDRYAWAKDDKGDVASYERFNTNRERDAWIADRQKEGYSAGGGRDADNHKTTANGVNPLFVQKVLELTKDLGGTDVADEIYQHYLESLPGSSYRKTFLHRKGVAGYSEDAMRAFATHSTRNAQAIASLKYHRLLDAKLSEAEAQKGTLDDMASQSPNDRNLQNEREWATDLLSEMKATHAWVKNPSTNKWANRLTGLGFHSFLGFNLASAARIHLQQYQNALPWLGARHGWGPATAKLAGYMKQFAGAHGALGDTLRGDQRKAWDEGNARGVFMNTQTNALTNAAQGKSLLLGDPNLVRKAAGYAQIASQYMFAGVEHLNRGTTYMAAYDLGREDGMSHAEAVEHAVDASQTTHFSYSPRNRPRILQGSFGKVAGLYASYGINQTYRILRDFRDGVIRGKWANENLTPEQRNIAAKTFAGYMGAGAATFGLGNLLTPVFGMANAMLNYNNDGPPIDSKAATHAYLVQHTGSKLLADAIMSGPLSALTRASFASTNYWDLFHREPGPDANAWERMASYLGPLGSMAQGGPLVQYATDIYRGAGLLRNGETKRAIEHFLPYGLRGLAKAARFAQEGVQHAGALPVENAQTMPRKELSLVDLAVQATGLTPQKLADRYEENSAKEHAVEVINGTPAARGLRAQILHHYALAYGHHDNKEMANAMDAARKFNKDNTGSDGNPTATPITYDTIQKSVRAQYQNARQEDHGVLLPKRMRAALERTYSQTPEANTRPVADEEPADETGNVGPPQETLEQTGARLEQSEPAQ